MTKIATTIDEQINLLESRGLIIHDRNKAREILTDMGYYRLGFYLFPFEKTYPKLKNRSHEYCECASFEDAVRLYYFDFDLRLLLMRYLNRIEIAFRSALINTLSVKHKDNPIWFVSPSVVNKMYARDFEQKVYTSDFRRNPVIHRHHKNNPNDRFAPAWKTIEFMTFGAVIKLYEQLKDIDDKIILANKFGIRQVPTFENYIHIIRQVRNVCAHGLVLYDFRLPIAIRRGPAGNYSCDRNNVIGALTVVKYMMSQISLNRSKEFSIEINSLYENICNKSPNLGTLIPDFSKI